MESLITFFAEYKSIIIIGHAISAAIGLGTATVSDVLFFKFIKDGKISNRETPILDTMTAIVWVAIVMLIVTGAMLFMSNPTGYSESSKFIVKMFIVAIITINGAIMTKYLHPRMQKISFITKADIMVKRIAFAAGAISASSWYLSFILGSVRSIPFSVATGLIGYFTILVIAVTGSQVMYAYYRKKFLKSLK